jgi:hypothetical protein
MGELSNISTLITSVPLLLSIFRTIRQNVPGVMDKGQAGDEWVYVLSRFNRMPVALGERLSKCGQDRRVRCRLDRRA